ncbi:uncharacterized protein [Oryza sativa Japonica Group]|uniref:Expressed protein n=2 Tax=Oryza sativa subsp. japonica TaxID=39947 RepID=Q53LR6_ORYSJ|nr:uncharacterized protein LOC4349996 [Oryza sativa Japonica Group]AAX96730.1 expressed protein [Oryza sativa Japonica Group]ABA91887.1 expressed protein [Oryza sativa Japonica Group]BAF27793.1 Os11g0197500 [Oryza sativa Japonica Group]BAH00246.1 unnamed protein product [Oryza sativa Japonica Group]BAT13052.1 Os11g0197500 [Oryza sativa Japonica Group]|eukprot:NP_001067430.1 Os11g0197500 [Oryza sativa Japonica Group]
MEEFTFFPAATSPRRDHRLGLVGSPPPLLFAAVIEVDDGDDGEEEEKMDLLWEDFNEELARAPPVCPLSPLNIKGGGLTATTAMAKDDGGGGEKQARRMYSGSVVRRRRRWSLLLMLRLLKNLFLAKNTRNNPRTAPI